MMNFGKATFCAGWAVAIGAMAAMWGCEPDRIDGPEPIWPMITILNSDLKDATDKVYLGIGGTYTFQWRVVGAPAAGIVRLYLRETANSAEGQIEITPAGGVKATQVAVPGTTDGYATHTGTYAFTPDNATFGQYVGTFYHIYAVLVYPLTDTATDQIPEMTVAETKSANNGQIRLGVGGVQLIEPKENITLSTSGDRNVTVTWERVGGICSEQADKTKRLHLYVDVTADYREGESVEVTPAEGIDLCTVETDSYVFSAESLDMGRKYYVHAKVIIDGNEVPEMISRAAGCIGFEGETSALR